MLGLDQGSGGGLSVSDPKLGASPSAILPDGRPARARIVELLLADDHPLLLRGMRQLFDQDKRFRVVATASDGERLLDAIERFPVDVVVMGWLMPYLDGEAVLRRLRGRFEAPRVVVYSGLMDPGLPRRVMALGGAAFCSKRQPPEELIDSVVAVAAGRMMFPYEATLSQGDPLADLTEREREILTSLVSGRAPPSSRMSWASRPTR